MSKNVKSNKKKSPIRQNAPIARDALPAPSAEELLSERDLGKYLGLLKRAARHYVVAVAANDTPWGPEFTKELADAMIGIGLRVNLFEKFRLAYAAAVDHGKLVFEKLGVDQTERIDKSIILDNNDKIRLISSSFVSGDEAFIQINDLCCPFKERGLIFVVYDKHAKMLIDVVWSDTYHNLACKHLHLLHQTVTEFVKDHPGVLPVGYSIPGCFKRPYTDYEKIVLQYNIYFDTINKNADKKLSILSNHYDEQGIREVLQTPRSYYDLKNVRQYEDISGKYVNIRGGHRVTADQPKITGEYICVYIFGDCRVFGLGNSDENTIESYLQRLFNKENIKVIVENHGDFADGFFSLEDYARNLKNKLNTLPIKAGDMIFVQDVVGYSLNEVFPIIDIRDIFNEPRNVDYYFDVVHLTSDGNRKIAEKLLEALKSQGILERSRKLAEEFKDKALPTNIGDMGGEVDSQLADYKLYIREHLEPVINSRREEKGSEPVIGAAVMNCNPFTLGHRYLIESAAGQCDLLIIFVVEEDKSVFPFADRLKLVEAGTKDIPNVTVIPSGKFVLSSLTFSEYFNKSELQDRVIDTSLDVTVFAQDIAPCLNITKRFAGEEPFDAVTRQYNETMRRILPQYGIEFSEIPRKGLDSQPISASRVRKLLDEKKFDELKKLVPITTFDYLMEKFK